MFGAQKKIRGEKRERKESQTEQEKRRTADRSHGALAGPSSPRAPLFLHDGRLLAGLATTATARRLAAETELAVVIILLLIR